jgi:hypothetical protein
MLGKGKPRRVEPELLPLRTPFAPPDRVRQRRGTLRGGVPSTSRRRRQRPPRRLRPAASRPQVLSSSNRVQVKPLVGQRHQAKPSRTRAASGCSNRIAATPRLVRWKRRYDLPHPASNRIECSRPALRRRAGLRPAFVARKYLPWEGIGTSIGWKLVRRPTGAGNQ